jgi:hypothetical protein
MSAGERTQGRRVEWPDFDVDAVGDYARHPNGDWFGITPDGQLAGLAKHDITEHEDGTITVSPSILVRGDERDVPWHGYLERGVWREV